MSDQQSKFPWQDFLLELLLEDERERLTEPQNGTWQSLFLKPVLEPLDSPRLEQRVKEAEKAMSQRFQEMRTTGYEREERQALQDALGGPSFLKNEEFEFYVSIDEPHWSEV
jgi:hypothetical protein